MFSQSLFRQSRGCVLGLVLAMPVLVLSAASSHGQDTPAIAFSQDGGKVIIQMTRVLGEFRGDGVPVLRVYGDGTVRVHFPVGMRKAGDYTMRLTAAQLKELLNSLALKGVLDFDSEAVRAEVRAVRAKARAADANSLLRSVSDKTLTHIEVNLASYKAANAGSAETNVQKKVAWAGLRDDAKEYANVDALVGLAAAERELLALTQSANLEKVE